MNTSSSLPATLLPLPEYLLSGSIDALRDDLTRDQLQHAVQDRLHKYPATTRGVNDPPIAGQSHGLVSFMLFKEPRVTKTGKKVWGYFKLRGNHPTEADAVAAGTKYIKEVDSKTVNRIAELGQWKPLCEDGVFVRDPVDVTEENQRNLRDQAVKEAEEEQRKIQRELREAEEALRNNPDPYDDRESLLYYSMRRVTEMRLTDDIEMKERALEQVEIAREKCRRELKSLEGRHPSFKDEWIETYNKQRRKVNLPDFRPAADKFVSYEEYRPENDDDEKH